MGEEAVSEKLQRGIEEQAAIEMIIRLVDEGLDPEIAGEYMAGVAEGKANQVLDTLGMNWPKLVKSSGR